jgi:hypothetical protein
MEWHDALHACARRNAWHKPCVREEESRGGGRGAAFTSTSTSTSTFNTQAQAPIRVGADTRVHTRGVDVGTRTHPYVLFRPTRSTAWRRVASSIASPRLASHLPRAGGGKGKKGRETDGAIPRWTACTASLARSYETLPIPAERHGRPHAFVPSGVAARTHARLTGVGRGRSCGVVWRGMAWSGAERSVSQSVSQPARQGKAGKAGSGRGTVEERRGSGCFRRERSGPMVWVRFTNLGGLCGLGCGALAAVSGGQSVRVVFGECVGWMCWRWRWRWR